MGRAFEFRKDRKLKRWDKMSKAFTRIGKEIAIAAKAGGPEPDTNPRLRAAIANAKGVNMPKDRIEGAIKRATSKDEKDYEETLFEGKGPHGVALMVECATDNNVRTVANIRNHFNKKGGVLGNSGSLAFMFDRKGIFMLPLEGLNIEEMELELIDAGADDFKLHEDAFEVIVPFTEFGAMQKALEERNIEPTSSELLRIPSTLVELSDEQMEEVYALIERLEEDDDVQNVYHNMIEE
ncbi:MAG: YebC/PmpR family DNA-binding transcriptional regulator [Bacteroidota bacterium]|nr:YebC/PmpR family DNA-binding transcriptional regulator [Bacteroidota bacterium]